MLKRLIILLILVVMIKPAYDLSTYIWNKAVQWMNDNQMAEKVENIDFSIIEQTAKETIAETASSISSLQDAIHLPTKVKSVDDLANAFFEHFRKWETDFEIQYVGSTSDIEHLIQQAAEQASNRDPYILGHLGDRKIEYQYGKYNAKIKVHQEYLTNPVLEQYVDEQVASVLANVDANSMSDFEKVKFVNDYIVKNTVYSADTTLSPHSAAAVLMEHKGVCQGYALLALKMLRELGVETLYITGEVNTGPHAWNLVKVNGDWYHLDTTWNDPVPDRKNMVSYKYFLVDDATMKLDHRWEEGKYPKATNKKYAFMTKIDHAYEQDGYIFYSNTQDNHRLYRLNLATGENIRLTNSRAQYIVAAGNWIYFSNYSRGAYLARIRTDGSEEAIIYRKKVSDLAVVDGYLIFETDEGLKKMAIGNL